MNSRSIYRRLPMKLKPTPGKLDWGLLAFWSTYFAAVILPPVWYFL